MLDVAGVVVVGQALARERVDDVLQRNLGALAAPPEGIDDLVTRDRRHPRRNRGTGLPRAPLQVQGEQHFLNDVLGIEPDRASAVPDESPQSGRQRHQ